MGPQPEPLVSTRASRPARPWHEWVAAASLFAALGIVCTWPLATMLATSFPSDPGDPALNASILSWNARVLPFTSDWWNALHYYPTLGVAAFTENLAALSIVATPIVWLTGNPILAHNALYILAAPLSGLAVYALVGHLSGRFDAALIAGVAFACSPYRATEISHLQSLSVYGLPLCLLGLHRYLADRHARWLWLFGLAWLWQSLANGYYLLYGAVLIGCWLVYFASRPRDWRTALHVLLAWTLASLPLILVLLHYKTIHSTFGFSRTAGEIAAYSATPRSWLQTSGDVWLWRRWLHAGSDNLFPGATAPLLILAFAASWMLRRRTRAGDRSRLRQALRALLWLVAVCYGAATLFTLLDGPWSVQVVGILIRVKDLSRVLPLAMASALAATWLTPSLSAAIRRRSPVIFYVAFTGLAALLCCGPALRTGDAVILQPAPYQWLLHLPGYAELRVITRLWMLGVLTLSVAAGLAFAALVPVRPRRSWVAGLAVVLLCLDGAMLGMRVATPPAVWSDVETRDRGFPLLELPLGPDWDYPATFRTAFHGRRLVNGVSGYDPPHYIALRTALETRDPAVLLALASFGPIDIVVNREADADGAIAAFVSATPDVRRVRASAARLLFHLESGPGEPALDPPLPITSVTAFRHGELLASNDKRAPELVDGHIDTSWSDLPQTDGQWIAIDLGQPRTISGVRCSLGRFYLGFPEQLLVDTSLDDGSWQPVWEGSGSVPAFRALVRAPTIGDLRLAFPPTRARYVRIRQTGHAAREWRVAEVSVHGPQ